MQKNVKYYFCINIHFRPYFCIFMQKRETNRKGFQLTALVLLGAVGWGTDPPYYTEGATVQLKGKYTFWIICRHLCFHQNTRNGWFKNYRKESV